MMTVSTLARRCGLSRTTLLYYETQGLLRRPPRTSGNYRAYSEQDLERVRHIGVLRKVGLSVAEIRLLLNRPGGGAAAILERRLVAIDAEIDALRDHQRAILRLLQRSRSFGRNQMITKDKWVAIMRAAGLKDEDMNRWHAEFEKNAPQEHQEFLEYLHIGADEIAKIREWSRKGAQG
jgi:MerR family transcriptional regulator, thiopeptide resistance regulator